MRDFLRRFFVFRHQSTKHNMAKAVVFTLFSVFSTGIITFLATDNAIIGLGVSAFDLITRIFVYYLFETGWNHIHRKS